VFEHEGPLPHPAQDNRNDGRSVKSALDLRIRPRWRCGARLRGLEQTPRIKKPARTRRGLLPGSLAGLLITCCNTRSSQGVLPMFIGFGHACVSDEEDWGRAGR
jgi:hypothetical protein